MDFKKAGKDLINLFRPDTFEEKLDINHLKEISIERIAIDQHGSLASFYDAVTDNITGKLNVDVEQCYQVETTRLTFLYIEGCKHPAQNLLGFVNIDPQLRLSILLKMNVANGIASFINHRPLINTHTRMFYVYQESSSISYGEKVNKLKKIVRNSTCNAYASHIITKIVYGLHLLIILQLPPNDEKEINTLLLNLHKNLLSHQIVARLKPKEKVLLRKISATEVYSNSTELSQMKKFEDIYEQFTQFRENKINNQIVKYILTPIAFFYHEPEINMPALIFCKPEDTELLEHYLCQQSAELRQLVLLVNHHLTELLQGQFINRRRFLQDKLSKLLILQNEENLRIRHLIMQMRQKREPYSRLANEVSLDPPIDIQKLTKEISNEAEGLKPKMNLIKRLQEDGFEYCDVSELGIRKEIKEETVKDALLGNNPYRVIFFSNDTFKKQDREEWLIKYSQMIEERRNNSRLQLVYADFTYSTYELSKMEIVILTSHPTNGSPLSAKTSLNTIKMGITLAPVSATNDHVNIVLLGESGVGKSTFINALANYLRFSSLDEAERGEPTVIIPVSYVMTIGDDFEERIIKFGEIDVNENHNDVGQSVTQQCKAYVFDINGERKLRIIDTPGFGDTRGLEQDDLNMEMIFSFLSNFNYVNGICLLFKSEVLQLNPYFRSCCAQLFDYFGENIRDHFIFCFTNARATFFAPGNIRPLLSGFFDSFPVKKIPFARENSFSFDSESFRYLVAIRNGIKFEEDQREEFQQSWQRSVRESQRFRDLLCRQNLYKKNVQWRSMKEAQFQINQIIRPMLETARNLLRNIILHPNNSSIQLFPIPAELSSVLCYSDNQRTIQKFGPIWIWANHLHHAEKRCEQDEEKSAEYRLDYELVNERDEQSIGQMNAQIKHLCETSGKLSYLLMNVLRTSTNDPFLDGIDRMIREERSICDTKTPNDINHQLIDQLNQFKTNYQNHLETNRDNLSVTDVYDLLDSLERISMVKIQMDAIHFYQEHFVNSNQRVAHAKDTQTK